MPAIRDYSQNYTSTTSATHLTCPSPAYAQNDLLIAPVSADTGTQVWSGLEAVESYWIALTAGTAYTNLTTQANNATTGDIYLTAAAGTSNLNNCAYWGHSSKFNAIGILVSTVGSFSQTWVFEYWNGSAWTALTLLTTNIATGATATLKTNTFNPPTDWTANVPGSTMASMYYVRLRCSAWTSTTTRLLGTQAYVGKWNQLYSTVNTVNQGVLYKIASASEPSEYTFAYNPTGDTANAAVISVRDIDVNIPISTVNLTENTTAASDRALGDGTTTGVSQSFAGAASRLASVTFKLKKFGSPTGNAVVKLYTHSGTFGTSSVPAAPTLAVSNSFDVSTLTGTYQEIEFTFPWYYQYYMSATNYCVAIEYSGGNASNYVQLAYNSSTVHAGNKATYASASWTAQSGEDCFFRVKDFTYTVGTANSVRSAMPTMTTSRADSLVMWYAANAGTSTSTLYNTAILEGPCSYLFAKDGTAHSDCLSWGMQRTAGTTSNAVYQTNLGTGTQTITTGVMAINPPSTGATIIPAYPASDSSLYISPLTGVAYSSDTAPATSVTTAFGATLNGATLAAAATTVTLADVGINTYHAMIQFSKTASTVSSWYGLRQTIASRNLSGKNLLFHIQPATPVAIQTTDSVALTGTCGIAIGLASTAGTNYKVYHVGGANSSWGISRHQPVIINTDYTGAGLIQNTGTLDPAAVVELGFMISGKVIITSWVVGSAWMLDTTAVCGGIEAEPLGITGIVSASSDGYERRSVISQGSSQFMIFQPLQIGDGGTNSVYLNLDSTALEFPEQYNKSAKNVGYCSVDNVCGLYYYPGSGDTIIHKNSVISSKSRYHWGIHASASTTASYDFSGLSVIGAGTILLNKAITITGLTINNYSTINATGLTLTNSTIKGCPSTSNSITLTAASNIDYCNIDVTGVAAAGQWCSVTDPSIFSHSTFTGSTSSGHAIKITNPGTYTLDANTFTGFGADGTTTSAIFNDSAGLVTLNITGGATSPTVYNGSGATTTINNAVTLTIKIVDASGNAVTSACEVTVVKDSDVSILYHVEDITTGTTDFSYSSGAGTLTYINVLSVSGYQPKLVNNYTLPSSNGEITIQLDEERFYSA